MKHVSDGAVYTSLPAQSKCKVCGAYYPHHGDGEGCPGPAPMPTQGAPAQTAWTVTQPPKEPRDAQMQRLRSNLLACVTLAGDLLHQAPRRVVAHRVFATTPDDGELCFGWQDGDAPGALSTAAAAAVGWRIERAYSE